MHEARWATDGLHMLATILEQENLTDALLTANYGASAFENDTFRMEPYCWCDYDGQHANGCPPNFFYKPTGVEISWYKHAGRGIECNKTEPSMRRWFAVIADCVSSLGLDD